MKNDEQIFGQLKEGNQLIFESIFHSYYKELVLYAVRFVELQEEAEEIVQNLFVEIWNKRKELNVHTSLRAYLFGSVRNTSLNYIKHKKVEYKYREYNDFHIKNENYTEKDILVEEELSSRIENAIEKLPPERKKIFIMSRFEQLKYKEIAQKLNVSIKTVENQMGRALKFLKEELSEFIPLVLIFLKNFF